MAGEPSEARMRVIDISRPGGPDVLTVAERERPAPGPGEVLIAVAAAGVNRPDLLQRRGLYPPPPGVTDIPGLEVSGEVVAVGPDVLTPRAGEFVCALLAGGGYADFAVAPAVQCLPVPTGIDLVPAAALPEACFTVWTSLFERGRLASGETLLVHGGASGIGTTAIQIAKARGVRVFATAGTPEKCRACEALGADRAFDYHDDWAAAVTGATGGRGVDVVLDMVAGDYTARNLSLLAMDGRLVVIAFLKGARVEVDVSLVMRHRLVITGSTLRARSVAEKGALARTVEAEVWPLVASGAVRPVVHAVFPLADAAAAHALLEAGGHVGKIVLDATRP